MNIDARLEAFVAANGGREYVLTRNLIAALLRARQALRDCLEELAKDNARSAVAEGRIPNLAKSAIAGHAALADTELEKALGA